MSKGRTAAPLPDVEPDFLRGGGEMGRLLRSKDWSDTPLGPPESWPQSLKTTVSIVLNSRYPMFIFWGRELVKIYNDGYRPITGDKHPWALGRPGAEVWPEIWDTIGPMVERVVRDGEATWSDDLMLFMHRRGYPEEVYFTFSYSPVHDETGGVGGMLCACTETTAKVLSERRLHTLRDLAAAPADARTLSDACLLSARVLGANAADVPFALVYLLDGDEGPARLAAAAGVDGDHPLAPAVVTGGAGGNCAWPLLRVAATRTPERVDELSTRFAAVAPGPWPEPPASAVVLPLMDRAQQRAHGLLVLGISSRRGFDDDYRGFFDLVAGQIAASLSNARASEAERKRAAMLAELNRAKTTFLSNVSHEFRTPLTLMMGPLEDALRAEIAEPVRRGLVMAQRNSRRLLKLVDMLLDFSRLEAGRLQAAYQRTRLCRLTRDLVGIFEAAAEKAGLRLLMECAELGQPVYVDRDMWEKIVLNLLSNALKFTLAGEIRVTLRANGDNAELLVADTGIGIPAEAIPHLFERFYRVPNARGRTHEGAGIGLALVHELVQLHGGSTHVVSEMDKGTTFTVSIPFGTAHLPQEQVQGPRRPARRDGTAAASVEEALRWLPDAGDYAAAADVASPEAASAPPQPRPRIVLADDNADMRAYVRRLLEPAYHVIPVADGREALRAVAERKPDLVLTDVMMPQLDGVGLLQALRADPATASIPVIMLSARAGEEARIEGAYSGADDYVVKPFHARELLARIGGTLALARVRREAEERVARILESITDGFVTLDREWRYSYLNAEAERLLGRPRAQLLGKCMWEEFPALIGTSMELQLRAAAADGNARLFEGFYPAWERWYEYKAYPAADGLAIYFRDVTARKQAEEALRRERELLQKIFDTIPVMITLYEPGAEVLRLNRAFERLVGWSAADAAAVSLMERCYPDPVYRERVSRFMQACSDEWMDIRMCTRDGREIETSWANIRLSDSTRVGIGIDITERTRVDRALREQEERYRNSFEAAGVSLWEQDFTEVAAYLDRLRAAGVTDFRAYFDRHPEAVAAAVRLVKIRDVNRVTLSLFGASSKAELSRSLEAIFTPRTLPVFKQELIALTEGRRPMTAEVEARTLRGEQRNFLFTLVFPEAPHPLSRVLVSLSDITERKRAEESLRESETRLADKLAMMKSLHDLSTRLLRLPDLKAVLEEVLAATLSMTAADAGNVRLFRPQSHTLEIATQRGFTQEFLQRFGAVPVEGDSAGARAMRSGARVVVEDVDTDPDFAPYRHVAASAGFRAVQSTPLLSRDGNMLGVLSTHFRQPRRLSESEERMLDLYARHAADFIERFRIEEALRESEERLRFALRSANAGVWRLDVATGENFWSDEFMALYGYDATMPQDYRTWLASVHIEDRERIEAEFRRRLDSDETEFQQEFRILHPERGVRWILDLGRVARDAQGRALSFSGINLDITERKQAEQALRDSERLYRAIGESINYGVWLCDPEGRNIYVSESFLRLVGLTQEECSSFGWGTALHPDDAERTLAAWRECVRTGGQWDIEHRYRGVDGQWHPVLARGVPVRNDRGEITAWAGINLDISRQKQVENELRQAHYRKDEFLATLAHELRNPLAPLRNGLEILRLTKDNRDAAEGARGMMERQLQQMVRLIDDLLDLSRISRGKVELRKQRIDLALVMQQAVETSRPLIEQSGHQLSISVPAHSLYVDADATRLAQVFANLLNNAAKYTGHGGRIALTVGRRGGEAVVRVRDNGRGIPAHMLAHVFEMFMQVDRPLENTHGGLGVGLSIVQQLVQMHGGSVEAYSDGPGMGSEFTVRLPLVAPLLEEASPANGEPRPSGAAGRRVLVADDNADAAASLAMMLKIMGNDVRTARDGLEAVEVARLFRPELILLDIGMPRLDGYDACRRIRAQAWACDAVIAALTGWGQEEDKRRSRDAGFDRHLVKPVEPAVLEQLLAALPRDTAGKKQERRSELPPETADEPR